MSWWSWQSASDRTWATLARPAPAPVGSADPGWPVLARGSTGDQVVWLQQHLVTADPTVKLDGRFTAAMETALRTFQQARGLSLTGETDPATWQVLLSQPLAQVRWTP
jgi:peptidoglycan hydrolase-like protein with peptidoglycan-binding domain